MFACLYSTSPASAAGVPCSSSASSFASFDMRGAWKPSYGGNGYVRPGQPSNQHQAGRSQYDLWRNDTARTTELGPAHHSARAYRSALLEERGRAKEKERIEKEEKEARARARAVMGGMLEMAREAQREEQVEMMARAAEGEAPKEGNGYGGRAGQENRESLITSESGPMQRSTAAGSSGTAITW